MSFTDYRGWPRPLLSRSLITSPRSRETSAVRTLLLTFSQGPSPELLLGKSCTGGIYEPIYLTYAIVSDPDRLAS